MSNLYHDSENVIAMIKSGEISKGSIIRVQWPSGNSEAVRVHRWDKEREAMVGCSMIWDNSATELYDLRHGVVSLIKKELTNA